MSKISVFVSFDSEHDSKLYELILAQSRAPSSDFEVLSSSEPFADTAAWSERARRRIRAADHVIIICGASTRECASVRAELEIAQREQIPYVLLWGRREIMCTKPFGAKGSDAMYGWTPQILQDRITLPLRRARAYATAERLRNVARSR